MIVISMGGGQQAQVLSSSVRLLGYLVSVSVPEFECLLGVILDL